MKNYLISIIRKAHGLWVKRSSESYVNYLRKCGISIDRDTTIFEPRNTLIDVSRPELLSIGKHVFIHGGMTILTHDWASWIFVEKDGAFYPSHAKVNIGDNVWFGRDVTICKGVTIGNNCIIGIGSLVTHSIPDNSIAVGVPAKVIGSITDYEDRREKEYVDEAIEYAIAIIKAGREPKIQDFYDDYPCFVDKENYKDYHFPYQNIFNERTFKLWLSNHRKTFNGFDDFIKHCKKLLD